jgi:hypothetical protein
MTLSLPSSRPDLLAVRSATSAVAQHHRPIHRLVVFTALSPVLPNEIQILEKMPAGSGGKRCEKGGGGCGP